MEGVADWKQAWYVYRSIKKTFWGTLITAQKLGPGTVSGCTRSFYWSDAAASWSQGRRLDHHGGRARGRGSTCRFRRGRDQDRACKSSDLPCLPALAWSQDREKGGRIVTMAAVHLHNALSVKKKHDLIPIFKQADLTRTGVASLPFPSYPTTGSDACSQRLSIHVIASCEDRKRL